MRLPSVRVVHSLSPERASARIALLGLISFFLGVAATVGWFRLAATDGIPNPIGAPAAPAVQPVAPSTGADAANQPLVEQPVPVAPADIEEVKRALPNYASLSLDEAVDVLRQAALKKFADAAQDVQSQVAKAQEDLNNAQNKSPAEQQAAMKHLQDVQAEQSRKLQQIAGHLQTQIAALKNLKSQQ